MNTSLAIELRHWRLVHTQLFCFNLFCGCKVCSLKNR